MQLENERMFEVRGPMLDRDRFIEELGVLRALKDRRDANGCLEQLRRMTYIG
ncbi:MAG: hypothetical protein CFH40_00056 [Alphaproteobacteria bacterium MarineAlpha10_Bin3]|nr:MAG: hypothetical protein CFH40_00056 [Alphaproteobacteria bacterium MarineAlpha10_Bin3]PPR75641.1 MAG: hypothetical protein CFH09_00056 [Alphaproteobacteria bacterium MarineAlpha4_Bin1]